MVSGKNIQPPSTDIAMDVLPSCSPFAAVGIAPTGKSGGAGA